MSGGYEPKAGVTAAGGRSCCLSSRRCPQSFEAVEKVGAPWRHWVSGEEVTRVRLITGCVRLDFVLALSLLRSSSSVEPVAHGNRLSEGRTGTRPSDPIRYSRLAAISRSVKSPGSMSSLALVGSPGTILRTPTHDDRPITPDTTGEPAQQRRRREGWSALSLDGDGRPRAITASDPATPP